MNKTNTIDWDVWNAENEKYKSDACDQVSRIMKESNCGDEKQSNLFNEIINLSIELKGSMLSG